MKKIWEILNTDSRDINIIFVHKIRQIFPLILVLWGIVPFCITISFFYYYYKDSILENFNLDSYSWLWRVMDLHTLLFYIIGTLLFIATILWLIGFSRRGFFQTLREEPWLVFFVLVLLCAIISTFLSEDPVTQFLGRHYLDDGLRSWFLYTAFFLAAYFTGTRRARLHVFRAFILIANVCAIIAFCQAFNAFENNHIFYPSPSSIFHNINYFGYYLCMSLMVLFGLWLYETSNAWRAIYLFSVTLQTYAILLDGSFGPYLGVLLALPAIYIFYSINTSRKCDDSDDISSSTTTADYCASSSGEETLDNQSGNMHQIESIKAARSRLWLVALIPVFIFILLSALYLLDVLPSGNQHGWVDNFFRLADDITNILEGNENAGRAGSGRYKIWVATVKRISERPLFGYGPEGFQTWFRSEVGNGRPHNEILQYAAFFGVPAALFYLTGLILLTIRRLKELRELDGSTLIAAGGVIGYFISALFGLTLFSTAPYYFMLLGFVAAGKPRDLEVTENRVQIADNLEALESKAQVIIDADHADSITTISETQIADTAVADAHQDADSIVDTISDNQQDTAEDILPKRHFSWKLPLMALASAVMIIAIVLIQIGSFNEKGAEQADVSAMILARSIASKIIKNDLLDEPTDFWLDVEDIAIYATIDDDGEVFTPPEPYGLGTTREGGGYTRQQQLDFGYDCREDYTDKVIKIHIDPEQKDISVEWVTP